MKKRTQKFVHRPIQRRFVLAFVGVVAASILVQSIVLMNGLAGLAAEAPKDGVLIASRAPGLLVRGILLSLLLAVPVAYAFAVSLTFPIVGPLFSIERHLRRVLDGEDPGPCHVRERDELQQLASMVDQVTEPVRAAARERRDAA